MFQKRKLGATNRTRPNPESVPSPTPVDGEGSYSPYLAAYDTRPSNDYGYGYPREFNDGASIMSDASSFMSTAPTIDSVYRMGRDGANSLTNASEAAAAKLFGLGLPPANGGWDQPVQSSRRYGYAEEERLNPQVEGTLHFIEQQWNFMAGEQFDPISMALSLMDKSSLGRDFDAFTEALSRLEKAMDILVNDYFKTFNDSIHTFSGVVETVADSQKRASQMRQALESSRDLLQTKRSDLMELWLKSVKFKEMLRMIDTIAELHDAPEKVDILLNQKYYLQALTTIQKSLHTMAAQEYSAVVALTDVRQNLERINSTLPETLIEELHNHIYLKNAFSMDRLWVYQSRQTQSGSGLPSNSIQAPVRPDNRRIFQNEDDEIFEDTDVNAELDSFHYMEVLLESLRMMNQIPAAIAALKQRFRIELFDLAERTADEIRERRAKMPPRGKDNPEAGGEDLREFLVMLYRRLEVVMQAHLFVLEVIRTKLKKTGMSGKIQLYSLSDVWAAVQDEVKSLLSDHLTETDATQSYATAVSSLNDLLRNPRAAKKEGEVKSLFQVPDPMENAAMQAVYRSLSHSSSAEPGSASSPVLAPLAGISRRGAHRVLAAPDSRRVLAVYQPTSEFVERMESVLATESAEVSDFRSFLDDFILNILLPKVEDEILEYFHELINGEDAFSAQRDERLSPFPLLNSVVGACALLESMGVLLHHLPVHKDHFVNIMEVVVWKFSEKCVAKYRHVMANESGDGRGSSRMVSATWAQEPSLANVLNLFYEPPTEIDGERVDKLAEEEFHSLEGLKGDRSFHRSELVFDAKGLVFLANLHHSLRWFNEQITSMRRSHQSGRMSLIYRLPSSRSQTAFWRLQHLLGSQQTAARSRILDIPADSVGRFDAMFNSLQIFSDTCLLTLRIEIRCHAFFFLDLAFIEGNYELEDEPSELDPYIIELNQDMVKAEEAISSIMPLDRVRFVFEGMDIAINKIVEKNIPMIRNVNANGKLKLRRGIGALEQLESYLQQQYPRV